MARCPLCGNKAEFSWSSLFSKRLDWDGREAYSSDWLSFNPGRMRFTCEKCKQILTLTVRDIVSFYLIFWAPLVLFGQSLFLVFFFLPIPIKDIEKIVIGYIVFLGIFYAAWVYFGISFVWWEKIVTLCHDYQAVGQSKRRFYAVLVLVFALLFFGAFNYYLFLQYGGMRSFK